jgi:SAM-dependent methyltransferase
VTIEWRRDRGKFSTEDYDARWAAMARDGHNPHGEVDFVMQLSPRSVLDAGCGTGRVAVELHRRGVVVVGVDLDPEMLAAARTKAPHLPWIHGDLSDVALDTSVHVTVMAGNVMLFVPDVNRARAVRNLASHLDDDGIVVAGFQTRWPGRELSLDDYDEWCAAAGLELVSRFATWDAAPFDGGEYAVSVHRRS